MPKEANTQHTTEQGIKSELEATLKQYRDGAQTLSASSLQELSAVITDLQAELGAFYSAGAKACPNCGNLPHGMERSAGVYEVGCLACLPQIVKQGAGSMRRSPAAQGKTPQEAVGNWNAGKRLEQPVQ